MIKDNLVDDIHFTRLKPLMISKFAPIIQDNLVSSMIAHEVGPDVLPRLMKGVHHQDIHVWVAFTGEGESKRLVGMVFTQIMVDPYLDTRQLTVYGLNLKVQITSKAFSGCVEVLTKFGRTHGCSSLWAQTQVSGVGKLMERDGWETKTTLHEKEI